MGKNIIKEEIVEMLEVIVEQSEVINSYDKPIPQIEIDIILSNIRELYSKFKALEKENKNQAAQSTSVIDEPIIHEINNESTIIENVVKTETQHIDEKKVLKEDHSVTEENPIIKKVTKEQMVPPVIIKEDNNNERSLEEVRKEKMETNIEQTEEKVKNKIFSPDLFTTHNTISDKFKDDKKSLNEKHSAMHVDKSIASKLKKNPVKDLKAAIGINEKFKFINDLFDGSLQKYNDCINQLDSFAGSEAALKYLSFLKDESGWKDSSEAYQELNDLVNRRYL